MRISTAMRTETAMDNVARLQEEHYEASVEASTGARVSAPSKDPAAAARAVRVQAALDRSRVQRETIRDVRGDLEQSESALAAGGDIMQRVREIAVSAANGSMPVEDRQLLATEVTSLRAEMLALANTKGTQGFLFGGSDIATAPFSPLGAFTGDDVARNVEISPGSSVRSN